MKQYEAVIQAMEDNGGYATLGHLYQAVLKIPGCEWGTKTPFASIRRIVQTTPAFFKIRPGLWGLTSQRRKVLRDLAIAEDAPAAAVDEFGHSFYQGLIVEIGNLRGYDTSIPKQDKNKSFLHRRLGDVASLPECYNFTYDHLVRKARTIDVTWFNDRKLPGAFFEVEHSTNMQNSLLKFLEFQDFRTLCYVVADEVRRDEFNDRVSSPVFSPLRTEVKFMDYQAVSELHSKVSAVVAAESVLGLSLPPTQGRRL